MKFFKLLVLSAVFVATLIVPTSPSSGATCKSLPLSAGVTAGYQNSFAWDNRGKGWAWGRGDYGQRGVGLDTIHKKPSVISGVGKIVKISSGNLHTLILNSAGQVFSSGDSKSGQLGLGAKEYSYKPLKLGLKVCVKDIFAIDDLSFLIDSAGFVWAWGDNSSGSLGLPEEWAYDRPTKLKLPAIVKGWFGQRFSIVKTKSAGYWHWGWGSENVTGSATSSPTPIDGNGFISNFENIWIYDDRAVGISNTASLSAWGTTYFAWTESPGKSSIPQAINLPKVRIARVAFGTYGAISDVDDLYTWGSNRYGILGSDQEYICGLGMYFPMPPCLGFDLQEDFDYTVFPEPKKILAGVRGISIGFSHFLALMNDGTVRAWGRGIEGQLGTGTEYNAQKPVKVFGLDLIP